jgi:NADP-dependent 3-hydroxy acid dehydrogenase YdfG
VSSAEAVPDYPHQLRLDGRVVVVLGAGAGIGRQCSHALAQAGATVVCVGRRVEPVEAVAKEIGGFAVTADVIRRDGMEHVFAEASRIGPVSGLVDIVGRALMGPVAPSGCGDRRRGRAGPGRHAASGRCPRGTGAGG